MGRVADMSKISGGLIKRRYNSGLFINYDAYLKLNINNYEDRVANASIANGDLYVGSTVFRSCYLYKAQVMKRNKKQNMMVKNKYWV